MRIFISFYKICLQFYCIYNINNFVRAALISMCIECKTFRETLCFKIANMITWIAETSLYAYLF